MTPRSAATSRLDRQAEGVDRPDFTIFSNNKARVHVFASGMSLEVNMTESMRWSFERYGGAVPKRLETHPTLMDVIRCSWRRPDG